VPTAQQTGPQALDGGQQTLPAQTSPAHPHSSSFSQGLVDETQSVSVSAPPQQTSVPAQQRRLPAASVPQTCSGKQQIVCDTSQTLLQQMTPLQSLSAGQQPPRMQTALPVQAQVTVWPQLLVSMVSQAPWQVSAALSGVQHAFGLWRVSQTWPPGQGGQTMGWPQLLVTVPHLPAQVTAELSGAQQALPLPAVCPAGGGGAHTSPAQHWLSFLHSLPMGLHSSAPASRKPSRASTPPAALPVQRHGRSGRAARDGQLYDY
jgi:hypothetical protein